MSGDTSENKVIPHDGAISHPVTSINDPLGISPPRYLLANWYQHSAFSIAYCLNRALKSQRSMQEAPSGKRRTTPSVATVEVKWYAGLECILIDISNNILLNAYNVKSAN
jgi:hypothetical protein